MKVTVIFLVNPLWNDLQLKEDFSLAFYAEKLKNHKIPFLVTKSGWKLFLRTYSDQRPKNCIFFYFLIFLSNQIFFLVGSHGFHGLFGAFCVACSWLKFVSRRGVCIIMIMLVSIYIVSFWLFFLPYNASPSNVQYL